MSWWVDALCAEIGGDFWHPEKGESAKDAKQLCAGCPVKDPCLAEALRHSSPGVFGGTTLREREAIKRARRAEAA